jgi:SAM-dependent methyltransferase
MTLRDEIGYRVLRRIAPTEPTHMSGAVYAGHSKLRTLLGDELVDQMRGADVLDFGCGVGDEAIEVASIARSVYGLDLVPRYLTIATEKAKAAGVDGRCRFGAAPPPDAVDYIYSLDSFEHFGDPASVLRTMHELLRPGGQVLISFGPTWYHPLGGHLFSVFPWAHLVFSEASLIRWRSHIRSDGATRFAEVEGGLNQMTIRRFEQVVAASQFRLVELAPVPIRRLRRLHSRWTREWTSAIVRCVLQR